VAAGVVAYIYPLFSGPRCVSESGEHQLASTNISDNAPKIDWTRNGLLAMLRCGVEESVAMHADGAEESRLELASLESRTAAAEADARDFFEPIMYQLVDGHCVTFAVGSTVPLNNSTPRAQFLSRE
jgi:hypothetical protein